VEGEESKRKKNRNEEPPALYSRDDSPAGLHSRAEERARWSFPAPARARASHPPLPRNRPQCAARSRAREKRNLAAFLPSRAAASVLAAAGRARRRAKAANTRACSPWAQGPVGPTSQTRPKRPHPWWPPAARQSGTAERPLERGPPCSRAERPLGRGPPHSRAPVRTSPPLRLTRPSI
jgi:hypothetical protein